MSNPRLFLALLLSLTFLSHSCMENASDRSKEDRKPPRLIAHRGASKAAPENTLPALDSAWKKGADAVEVDVRLTSDGHIVAIHDRTTTRTSDRKDTVSKTPYDSLARADAGTWFDPEFEGTRIPLLDTVFDHVPFHKELLVEIKSGPETIDQLRKLLSERTSIPAFSLISFDRKVVERAKERFPEIPVYWVVRGGGSWKKLIRKAQALELDGINAHHRSIDERQRVERVHDAGLHLLCWTVNDTVRAKDLQEMGIDGIVTDEVAKMRSVLKEDENP